MSHKQTITVNIRWATALDIPAISAIDFVSMEHPASEDEFIRLIRQRTIIILVAEIGQQIVGYAIYQLLHDVIDIATIAVDPEFRRMTVGTQLVSYIKGRSKPTIRPNVEAVVSDMLVDAQLFFKKNGFRGISMFRDYHGGRDHYLMRYKVESPENPNTIRLTAASS